MTKEEQIEILSRRVSDLETICGLLGAAIIRHEHGAIGEAFPRKRIISKIIEAGEAKRPEETKPISDNAFRNVTDFIMKDMADSGA